MSRKKPTIVYAIRDENSRVLTHVLGRSPRGALIVAKNFGIEGGKHADEARHMPPEKCINAKGDAA